jgi:hypothetical protein
MAEAPVTKKGGKKSRTYLLIGGAAAAAYVLYRYEKNKSASSTTAASTSTTCTCDDGSTPNSSGMCSDGTTCGSAGSVSSGGGGGGVGSSGEGQSCVLPTGLPGIVDFNGNCVAVTVPPGKGPTKKKPPKSCPKGQRLIGGKCTTSCPPGYERLTKTSDCTKKPASAPAAKACPPGYERKTPTAECTKITPNPIAQGGHPSAAPVTSNQPAPTTNRPASGGTLVKPGSGPVKNGSPVKPTSGPVKVG